MQRKKLSTRMAKAFDAFECDGYAFTTAAPKDMRPTELAACIAIIKAGEAVDWRSAERELPMATTVAVAWKEKQIVGIGAIKRERRVYAAGIAAKSNTEFPPEALELGYIAVAPEHRGHHISDGIVRALLTQWPGRLFATTYNKYMKDTLVRAGFVKKGREWKGRTHILSFWERRSP